MSRLFDTLRLGRWTGSRALSTDVVCPWCQTSMRETVDTVQPPLFSHAGYGAATRTIIRSCDCRLTAVVSQQSVSPRPYR